MKASQWNQNLLGQTRWQIVCHLRRNPSHVRDLADLLGLTTNAVRPHLLSLERDDLVRQGGRVQSGGKPALLYELTPTAEQLFPKAYGLILNHLIPSLRHQLSEDQFTAVIKETAHRLALLFPPMHGTVQERMSELTEVVNHLGGLAELEKTAEGFAIQGYSCPFREAADGNPEVCRLAEILLSEMAGITIREVCDKTKTSCRFTWTAPDKD